MEDIKDIKEVMLCKGVADFAEAGLPSATQKDCGFCGQKVWVSPSSPDMKLICNRCFEKIPAHERKTIGMPTDEQIKEIADNLGLPEAFVKQKITAILGAINKANHFDEN